VDPLEILFVREVMRTNVMALRAGETVKEFACWFRADHSPRGQHLYPVLHQDQKIAGVITRKDLEKVLERPHRDGTTLGSVAQQAPTVAYANEPLRAVAYRMAERQFTRMPVLDPEDGHKLVGMISLEDMLSGRARTLTEERTRERVLRLRMPGNGK
jgi:CBS domain-containing protein